MDFLEQIYNDGLFPQEMDKPDSNEYRQALQQVEQFKSKLIASLNEDSQELLEQFLAAQLDAVSIEQAFIYAEGYRTGARTIIDVYKQ